jgi:hypothetical protein
MDRRSSLQAFVLVSAFTSVAAWGYCPDGDTPAELYDSSDGGAHDMPHRVAVWIIPVFIGFYAIVIALMSGVYSLLRAGPAERYAAALKENEIVKEEDSEDDPDAISTDDTTYDVATEGWLNMPISAVQAQVRTIRPSVLKC